MFCVLTLGAARRGRRRLRTGRQDTGAHWQWGRGCWRRAIVHTEWARYQTVPTTSPCTCVKRTAINTAIVNWAIRTQTTDCSQTHSLGRNELLWSMTNVSKHWYENKAWFVLSVFGRRTLSFKTRLRFSKLVLRTYIMRTISLNNSFNRLRYPNHNIITYFLIWN